jgi:hypothetical protein
MERSLDTINVLAQKNQESTGGTSGWKIYMLNLLQLEKYIDIEAKREVMEDIALMMWIMLLETGNGRNDINDNYWGRGEQRF